MELTIDKDGVPAHYTVDGPGMKGMIDLHYLTSAPQTPGDARRISSLDLTEQIGSSTINMGISMDYQAVDMFLFQGMWTSTSLGPIR